MWLGHSNVPSGVTLCKALCLNGKWLESVHRCPCQCLPGLCLSSLHSRPCGTGRPSPWHFHPLYSKVCVSRWGQSEQPDCDLVFSNITREPLPREVSCVLFSLRQSAPANRSPARHVIRLHRLPCAAPGPVFYFSLSSCWHLVQKRCTDSLTLHSALIAQLCQEWTRSFSEAPQKLLVCI